MTAIIRNYNAVIIFWSKKPSKHIVSAAIYVISVDSSDEGEVKPIHSSGAQVLVFRLGCISMFSVRRFHIFTPVFLLFMPPNWINFCLKHSKDAISKIGTPQTCFWKSLCCVFASGSPAKSLPPKNTCPKNPLQCWGTKVFGVNGQLFLSSKKGPKGEWHSDAQVDISMFCSNIAKKKGINHSTKTVIFFVLVYKCWPFQICFTSVRKQRSCYNEKNNNANHLKIARHLSVMVAWLSPCGHLTVRLKTTLSWQDLHILRRIWESFCWKNTFFFWGGGSHIQLFNIPNFCVTLLWSNKIGCSDL